MTIDAGFLAHPASAPSSRYLRAARTESGPKVSTRGSSAWAAGTEIPSDSYLESRFRLGRGRFGPGVEASRDDDNGEDAGNHGSQHGRDAAIRELTRLRRRRGAPRSGETESPIPGRGSIRPHSVDGPLEDVVTGRERPVEVGDDRKVERRGRSRGEFDFQRTEVLAFADEAFEILGEGRPEGFGNVADGFARCR